MCVADEKYETLKKQAAAGTDLPTAYSESPSDDESPVDTRPWPQRNPGWANFWVLLALLGGIVAAWLTP